MRKTWRIIFRIFLVLTVIILLFSYQIINLYFGWFGYQQWKYRRCTYDKKSAIKRGVFIKDLNYFSSIDSIEGDFYIEKAWRCSVWSVDGTRTNNINSNYRYQFCPKIGKPITCINPESFKNDSIVDYSDDVEIFLKEPELKDTIIHCCPVKLPIFRKSEV